MAKVVIKKKVTAEQYQNALDAYKNNEITARALAVKRDKEVARLDEKYNPLFEEYMEQQKQHTAVVQQYCEEVRDVLFDGRQSIKNNGIEYGFRKGKVKVEFCDGVAEDSVLNNLKAYLPDYVRTMEQIAKDKLIADRDVPLVSGCITDCGLRFASDEVFFIKVLESRK